MGKLEPRMMFEKNHLSYWKNLLTMSWNWEQRRILELEKMFWRMSLKSLMSLMVNLNLELRRILKPKMMFEMNLNCWKIHKMMSLNLGQKKRSEPEKMFVKSYRLK